MDRFGNGGSIIIIASISGHGANQVSIAIRTHLGHDSPGLTMSSQGHPWVSYNTSKSAVLQMARSMACELGPKRIRVNTISPGYINTRYEVCTYQHQLRDRLIWASDSMTGQFLAKRPGLVEVWSSHNPLGRIGRPDELRGIVAWLASDASSFCTGSE